MRGIACLLIRVMCRILPTNPLSLRVHAFDVCCASLLCSFDARRSAGPKAPVTRPRHSRSDTAQGGNGSDGHEVGDCGFESGSNVLVKTVEAAGDTSGNDGDNDDSATSGDGGGGSAPESGERASKDDGTSPGDQKKQRRSGERRARTATPANVARKRARQHRRSR